MLPIITALVYFLIDHLSPNWDYNLNLHLQFKTNMLIRKINNVDGKRLRIGTMAVDPHGKMVCIYQHERSQFMVVQTAVIYKHFEQYRIDYFENSCYDNKHRLPHLLAFKSEQILQAFPTIQFSNTYEESQFIVIYYCTFVEIIQLNIDRMEPTFRLLYKLTSEILELTIINENIYITVYDGSMFNISFHRIQAKKKADICKKISFITESMKQEHVGNSQSLRLDQDRKENYKLWQTFSGKLMENKKTVSNEFEDSFDYQTSFEQYCGKQSNEKHPIKYQMSRCRQYLIGSSTGKLFSVNTAYTIKSRWSNWAHLIELSFKPQINPFWTCYQQLMNKHQNWGFPMLNKNNNEKQLKPQRTDKILIAYYCSAQSSLIVSWIIVEKNARKRMSIHTQTKKGLEQTQFVKYKSTEKVILRASYLKNPISELRWIGLNQLLLIDEKWSLFFVEFDPYILRN